MESLGHSSFPPTALRRQDDEEATLGQDKRFIKSKLNIQTSSKYEGEKDCNDDRRDEITDFVQSILGFQECDEDIETWMAIDAEDSADFKC
ncbi:hypothetical protein TNCV_4269791 [Trichonephila clavipes]|nr:hypothetical protein TNCV_4269791 [Trichonephila clavipes]